MKVAAIIGRPGTGKTHLVRSWMDTVDDWQPFAFGSLVKGHYSPGRDIHVLGIYEGKQAFAGTDMLSMSVQPGVLSWFDKQKPAAVLLEGDRLGNASMLDMLIAQYVYLKVLALVAPDTLLCKRYMQRGSRQSDTFLKGRATKVANLQQRYALITTTMDHIGHADTEQAMRWINSILA